MNFDTWYDLYAHPLEPRKDAAKRYAEEQGIDDPAEKQGFLDSIPEYQYADPVTTEYDTGFGDWTPPEPPPPTTSIDYEDDPSFLDSLERGLHLAGASAYGIGEGPVAGFLDDIGLDDTSTSLKDWAREGRVEQEREAAKIAPAKTIKEELAADPDSWYKYFDEDMMTMGQVAEAAPTSLAPFAAALPLALATPYLTSAAGITATGSLASKLIAGGVAMGTGNVASSAFVASEAYERGKEDKIIRKQLKVDPDKKFEDLVPSDQQKIDKVATDLSQTSFGHRLYTSGLVEMASYIPYGHAMLRLALDTGLGTASEVWDRTLYSEDAVEALIENGVPAEKADELRNAIIDAGPSFRQTLISALQQEFMMGGAATGIESLIGKTPPQVNAQATASKLLKDEVKKALELENERKQKQLEYDRKAELDRENQLLKSQAQESIILQKAWEQQQVEQLRANNKELLEQIKHANKLEEKAIADQAIEYDLEDTAAFYDEEGNLTADFYGSDTALRSAQEIESRFEQNLPVSVEELNKYNEVFKQRMANLKKGSDLERQAKQRQADIKAKIKELTEAEAAQDTTEARLKRKQAIEKEETILKNMGKIIFGVKGENASRFGWPAEKFLQYRAWKKRKLALEQRKELENTKLRTQEQIERRKKLHKKEIEKQATDLVDKTIKPSAIQSDGEFGFDRDFIQEYVNDLGNRHEKYKGIYTVLNNKSVPDLANILIREKYIETKGLSEQEVRAKAELEAEKLLSENNAWVMGDHVYVNADNIKGKNREEASENLVKIVTFHEPIAHLGLKQFLGSEYVPFLDNFFNTNKKDIQNWAENEAITDQGDAAYLGGMDFNDLSESQQRDLAEEFLANKFVELGILDPDIVSKTADSLISALKGILTPSKKRITTTQARSVLAEIQRQYLGGKKNIITGDFFDPANWTMKGVEVSAGEDKVEAYRRYLKEQGIVIERGEKEFIKKEFAPRPTEPKTAPKPFQNRKIAPYEIPIKASKRVMTPREAEVWKVKNKIGKGRKKRFPELQTLAKKLGKGEVSYEDYQNKADELIPIKRFNSVPKAATDEEILGSIKKDQYKDGLILGEENLKSGKDVVDVRLDIPAYETYDTWVATIKHGGKNIYGGAVRLKDVTFKAPQMGALRIAQGANKYPLATMKGTWQKNSVADIEKMAKDYINDPNWVQIGYNPERQSSFYIREDKNGEIKGTPLESADEIIQVGAFILAKNPTTKAVPESQVRFSKQPLSNEEIATKYSLPISKSIKDSLPDEAVMLSPIGKIEYIRTIESGSLVGSIKFSKKMLGNLDAKTSKELQKKLMGKNIVALVGDRLKRGDYIPMHGNKSENKEVMEKLHGGPEYAFDLTNIGKLGRAAWASGAGRITVIANALKELKTNIGSIIVGSPEQHMSNMDFWNVVWGETLDASKLGTFDKDGNLKKDKDGNIKKLDINWLNSYIAGKGKLNKDGSLQKNTKPLTELTYKTKEQDPKDKTKEITVINDLIPKKLKSKVTDFNSLMSIGEQLPFKARKEILVKLFGDPSKNTVKDIMSKANGIDITEIIRRTSAYPDAEVGDMVGIVEFDIDKNGEAIVGEAKDMDITPHPSYPTVIMGRAIAKYEKPIPMEKWGRDWLTAKRYNKEGPTGQRPFFPKKKQKKFEKTYFYTNEYLKVIRGETDKIPSKERIDFSPSEVRALAKRTIEMAPGQRKLKVTEGMFPEYNIDGSIKASKRLYHGSPETFDKFKTSKIGRGRVYGWGLYFTNDKRLAEVYASQVPEGWAKKDIKKRVYEVSLAPKEVDYMDWELPLRKQSKVVKKGVNKILKTLSPDSVLKRWFKLNAGKMTGQDFYRWVTNTFVAQNIKDYGKVSEKKASLYLLSKGIRGNKIGGTKVIFSEGDIKIDAMYSKRLATAKKLEAEWRANILKVENAPPPIRIVDKVSISKEARDILNAKPTKEDLTPKGILHPDGNIKASKVLASRASSFALKTKDIGKKLPLRYRIAEKLTRRITPQGTLPDRLRWLAIRRLVKGEITGIEDASRNLYNILKNTKQADVIYKYFTTRDFDANKITNKIERKAAIKAKETIDNIGDQLVKNDLLEKGARDQLKGMYLPQVYLKYLLKDDNAFVRVRGGGGIQIDQSYLKQRLPEEKLPKEIRELILGQIKDPAYLSSKAISVPAKDMAILNWLQQIAGNENWVAKDTLVNFDTLAEIKNINLPLKIKKELEFKDTAGVKVSSHWLKNESERIWGMTKFMNLSKGEIEVIQELTNKMGKVADSANNNYDPKLFTQVPKTKKYGMLAGMAVRKEIAQDIFGGMNMTTGEPSIAENILGDTGTLGSFNRFWKWSKVSANPPSWVRNFVSNMILMNMSGVPFYRMPDLILSSLKDMRKRGKDQGKLHQLAKDLGLTTGNFSNVELARIEREFKDLQNRLKNKKAGSMSVIGMIKGAFNKVQDSTSDFYGGIDTLGKMMVLKYNLDKNKLKVKDLSEYSKKEMVNIDDIAYTAEKWLFDYSNVLPSVKYLRNVPFGAPFASFTSFVGPLMLETAITKPWKFLPYYALGWAMKEMFKDEFDLDEEQYEGFKVSMSDYLREKAYGSFFPRAVIPFPFLDENKRIQFMDVSYLYPWGMFSEVAGEISEGEIGQAIKTAGLLGSPGLNIASAIMTGIDPFTRKEIVDETGTPSEKAADLLWYAFNLSAPPMLHGVFQGPNQGFGAVKRLKDAFSGNLGKDGEAKFTKGQALGRMVGMNITPIAVPEGRNKQLRYEYSQLKKIEYRARREITNMIMMQMDMGDIRKEAKKWGEKLNSEREKFVKKLKISVPPMQLLREREKFLRQKVSKARDYLSSIRLQEAS